MDWTLLIAAAVVIFFAALFRSTFGFGDALIAMPILALFLSIKTASPVMAVSGLTISVGILISNRDKLIFREMWRLILFSFLGIPIGIYFIKNGGEGVVKLTLAIILIIFSLYNIFKPGLISLKSDRAAPAFGILSGILGGAYLVNGPPIIIYGALKGWEPQKFRIYLQAIFLPTNLVILAGHIVSGLWQGDALKLIGISVPLIIIAIITGSLLNKKISKEKFVKLIYYFLILIALVLMINSIKIIISS